MDTDDPLAELFLGLDEIEGNAHHASEDSDQELEPENTIPENVIPSRSSSPEPMELDHSLPKSEMSPPKPMLAPNRRPSFVKLQEQQLRKRRSSVFNQETEWLDVAAGINITDRKVSADVMSDRLNSFELLTFHQVTIQGKSKTLPDIWAFYGIVCTKDLRQSSKGKPYLSIKLTNFTESINLLVFSAKLRKVCSKLPDGSFILVANPEVLDSNERFKGVALVVSDENQIIDVGRAKDFSMCVSKTKRGQCKTAVNLKHGKYCAFHVKMNYKKVASRRGDVNRSLVRRPSFGTVVKDMSAGGFQFNGDELSTTKTKRIKQDCKMISKEATKGASRRSITIAQAGLTPNAQDSPKAIPKLGRGVNLNESFEINQTGAGKKHSAPAHFQMPAPRPRRITKSIRKPQRPNVKRRPNGKAVPMRKTRRKAAVFQQTNINTEPRRKPTPIPSAETLSLPPYKQRIDSPLPMQVQTKPNETEM